MFRALAYKIFMAIVGCFAGRGWGGFVPIGVAYRFLSRTLMPEDGLPLRIHGHKMFTQGLRSFKLSDEVMLSDSYEREQTILFRRLVGGGMTVVDVGADVGYYTLLAARAVGEKGRVFAFEPEPQNYNLLLRNVRVNGYRNVVLLRKAVSDRAGRVKLFLSQRGAGQHSLYSSGDGERSVTVDAVSLDGFFGDGKRPIDVVKMDIEGAEMPALLGMGRIAKRNSDLKLFVEFYPDGFKRSGYTPREFWGRLSEIGFDFIYLINERERKLEQADFRSAVRYCEGTRFRKPTYVNLLCTKRPLNIGVGSHG